MSAECFPMSAMLPVSALYGDYLASAAPVRGWYGSEALTGWMGTNVAVANPGGLADALAKQAAEYGAGPAALANIELLREGARAVVTGQQVGLFGGPLYTLLKAATAIARATEASRTTGVPHVPVFWIATEDHDLAEVDQVALLSKHAVETLKVGLTSNGGPVGAVPLGPEIAQVLDQASELMAYAPVCDLLRECYEPREGYAPTMGGAFARLMTRLFEGHGLIVLDAAERAFHELGATSLKAAIERAEQLETALLKRTDDLTADGYHSQVLVKAGASLLFLLDATTGQRLPLRRLSDGTWKAGNHPYTTDELLQILQDAPERISPNALLRPIFQDTILPTAAYIGGPAEIAYFAQSAVLYQAILGRLTPVLPRLSATVIEPAMGALLAQHELQLPDVMVSPAELAQRLGARAMPIEGKRKISAVGHAMDKELTALVEYLASMDESLGRSAAVSGSKMRYQMNRLRRMAATFELQKETSLRKHADALTLNLFPNAHPQERLLAGVWFLARNGEDLVDRFVQEAAEMCAGHAIIRL